MSAPGSEKVKKICDGVWDDRAVILSGRGVFRGEEPLAGAAYRRLCEAGRKPGESIADCAPFLRALPRRYRAEAAPRTGAAAGLKLWS